MKPDLRYSAMDDYTLTVLDKPASGGLNGNTALRLTKFANHPTQTRKSEICCRSEDVPTSTSPKMTRSRSMSHIKVSVAIPDELKWCQRSGIGKGNSFFLTGIITMVDRDCWFRVVNCRTDPEVCAFVLVF